MLQKAFLRGASIRSVCEILTVANKDLIYKVQDNYNEVNASNIKTNFILEPFGRNTAAAVASAALKIEEEYGPDAVMLVLAADHLITDQAAFEEAVEQAVKLSLLGKIVTFGIKPHAPETGFGYIEVANNEFVRFVEKPSSREAEEYVNSGRFFWNSGIFCFKASVLIQEMKIYCPDVLCSVKESLNNARLINDDMCARIELRPEEFSSVPDISIDYAVMERSSNIAVVPCDIGWSDIGSWAAFGSLGEPDKDGNIAEGEVSLHDVKNCYIRSESRLVGAVGVDDLIIVDTADALLVTNKNSAQDVKHIYSQLKANNHQTYKLHRTVNRPWGAYTVLEEGDRFKIKRIVVQPGQSLSLQMHYHRSEHWIVVQGAAIVINGDREIFVSANESTYIPAGHKHRLTNPGVVDLILIEVQSGEYLGEDDIVRFEDNYGRV